MRLSCPFVLLAIYCVAQSQCAPINPSSVVNQLSGHLEDTINSAPVAHDVLAGNILSKRINIGNAFHQLSGDVVGDIQATPVANDVLKGNVIDKRGLGLPTAGLTKIAPGIPSLDSVSQLGGIVQAFPGVSNFPSTTAIPALNSLPPVNAFPGLAHPSIPNLGASPLTGVVPGITSVPVMSTIPGLNTLPGLSTLKSKRGLGNLSSAFSGANGIPTLGVLPTFHSLPIVGSGGLPIVGSPTDAANGFFGSASGLTNPLNGMF